MCLTIAQWLINFELYYSIKRKVAKLYSYFLFSYRLLYIWLLLLLQLLQLLLTSRYNAAAKMLVDIFIPTLLLLLLLMNITCNISIQLSIYLYLSIYLFIYLYLYIYHNIRNIGILRWCGTTWTNSTQDHRVTGTRLRRDHICPHRSSSS